MRLGVMWPGVMPDGPGKVDGGYLASVGRVVDALWKRGVHSILELHQDMLSPHLCGEGAPLWANLTPAALGGLPLPLPVGGSALPLLPSGLPNCSAASTAVFPYFYGSDLVGRSFAAIYQDQPPQRLGTQLKIFWGEVARHFATRDGVLAYELLNEIWHLSSTGSNCAPALAEVAAYLRPSEQPSQHPTTSPQHASKSAKGGFLGMGSGAVAGIAIIGAVLVSVVVLGWCVSKKGMPNVCGNRSGVSLRNLDRFMKSDPKDGSDNDQGTPTSRRLLLSGTMCDL